MQKQELELLDNTNSMEYYVSADDYYVPEDLIYFFWECNIKQDYKSFDFIKAFELFEKWIHQRLAEHGLLGYKDFKHEDECYNNYDCLKEVEQVTDFLKITKEDLKLVLIKYKFTRSKVEFGKDCYSNLQDLMKVYNKIQKAKNGELSQKEMVFLFDEIIHTQHENGSVFEGEFNIETLRKEFEDLNSKEKK